jgi:hypothetical protein
MYIWIRISRITLLHCEAIIFQLQSAVDLLGYIPENLLILRPARGLYGQPNFMEFQMSYEDAGDDARMTCI